MLPVLDQKCICSVRRCSMRKPVLDHCCHKIDRDLPSCALHPRNRSVSLGRSLDGSLAFFFLCCLPCLALSVSRSISVSPALAFCCYLARSLSLWFSLSRSLDSLVCSLARSLDLSLLRSLALLLFRSLFFLVVSLSRSLACTLSRSLTFLLSRWFSPAVVVLSLVLALSRSLA